MNIQKSPLEKVVVKKILERLRSRGGFWIKLHGSPFMLGGLPDIIGCFYGHFYAFEVKRAPGIKPSSIQEFYLDKIKRAGGIAAVISSVDEALSYLSDRETD